jgi:mRNA interferase YafQ
MRQYTRSSKFKKDFARVKKRNWDINKLIYVIDLLCTNQTIPKHYRNHMLKGKFTGYYNIHIYKNSDTFAIILLFFFPVF